MVQFLGRFRHHFGAKSRKDVLDKTASQQKQEALEQEIADLKTRLARAEAESNDRRHSDRSSCVSVDVAPTTPLSTSGDDWSVDGSIVAGDWQHDSLVAQTNDTSWSSAGLLSAADCQYESAGAPYASDFHKPKVACTFCEDIATAFAELEREIVRPGSSAETTRLFDASFWTTRRSKCYVPQQQLVGMRTRSHNLVTEFCHGHLQTHCPELALLNFPEGSGQFRLGFGEIMDFQYPDRHTGPYRTCIAPCPDVKHTLCLGTSLRNSDCHWEFLTPHKLEKLLARAQRMAVIFQDVRAAHQIRRWRDDLQEAVETEFAEIERRFALGGLPEQRWETHHERFFDEVSFNLEATNVTERFEWPESVARCAKQWRERKIRPGELDPQYLENVKQAATLLRHSSDETVNSV